MSDIVYNIMTTLIGLVALLIGITLHEVAHGYAAYKLGDSTAKEYGRLSLNPFDHINPASFGLLVVLMLIGSLAGGGNSGFVMSFLSVLICFTFARPVPVDGMGLKNPRRDMAIISIVGPGANIVLAFVSMLLTKYIFYFWFTYFPPISEFGANMSLFTSYFFVYLTQLNIGLAVFNLIPIPPLDGSKILYYFLPRKALITFVKYERYITLVLLFLLVFDFLDSPIDILGNIVYRGLSFIVNLFPIG